MRVKRRLYQGTKQEGIVPVARLEESHLGQWISFKIIANWDKIRFSFGDHTATIEGPLDLDGANKIAIAPGTRLRKLRLGVFDQQLLPPTEDSHRPKD